MLKSRNALDDQVTLAAGRDSPAPLFTIDLPSDASDARRGDGAGRTASGTVASAHAVSHPGAWSRWETWAVDPQDSTDPVGAGQISEFAPVMAMAVFTDAPLAQVAAATSVGPAAAPSAAFADFSPATAYAGADFGTPKKSGFSKDALKTTQPQVLDFTSGPQGAFGSNTSFSFSLPSFLYQHYAFGIGAGFGGFGIYAGASITGGIRGSVALSLGTFTPDYPITIDPGVAPFVQAGQVFSIDPSLVSTNDANFSLSLPEAHAALDFGLKASAGVSLSFPSIRIGVTLPR